MAKEQTRYSATVIVRVAVDVPLKATDMAAALVEAQGLHPTDVIGAKRGGSFNDFEKSVISVQSSEWL